MITPWEQSFLNLLPIYFFRNFLLISVDKLMAGITPRNLAQHMLRINYLFVHLPAKGGPENGNPPLLPPPPPRTKINHKIGKNFSEPPLMRY